MLFFFKLSATLDSDTFKTDAEKTITPSTLSHTFPLTLSAKPPWRPGWCTKNVLVQHSLTSRGNGSQATVSRRRTILPPWKSWLVWAFFFREEQTQPGSYSHEKKALTEQNVKNTQQKQHMTLLHPHQPWRLTSAGRSPCDEERCKINHIKGRINDKKNGFQVISIIFHFNLFFARRCTVILVLQFYLFERSWDTFVWHLDSNVYLLNRLLLHFF